MLVKILHYRKRSRKMPRIYDEAVRFTFDDAEGRRQYCINETLMDVHDQLKRIADALEASNAKP
jgi:hypothetical protein